MDIGILRRHVWKAYHKTLSNILQGGLPYPLPGASAEGSPSPSVENFHARLQQRAELQHVQNTYESLMLEEVKFPKADEVNEEIEEWVESVVGNWRVLCGSTWQDDDLGEGGREGVSRSVLEVRCYRKSDSTLTQIVELTLSNYNYCRFSTAPQQNRSTRLQSSATSLRFMLPSLNLASLLKHLIRISN